MSNERWIGGLGRSGLDDSQPARYLESATLVEVAQALGVTTEGARQIITAVALKASHGWPSSFRACVGLALPLIPHRPMRKLPRKHGEPIV